MSAESEPIDREFVMLLTAEAQLRQRMGAAALGHYFEAVRREVQDFFQQHPPSMGLDLQVAIALLPDQPPLIDLQIQPHLHGPTETMLVRRLETVEVPAVWNGPAAFSFRQLINGGSPDPSPQFLFPFVRLCSPLREGEPVDQFLTRCAAVRRHLQHDPWQEWWQSGIEWLRRRLPKSWSERLLPPSKSNASNTVSPVTLPDLPPESEEDLVVPDLSPMPLDQIDQQLAMFPQEVRHYWRRILFHLRTEDHARIVQDCRAALLLQPDDSWTLITLICALRNLGDSAGALSHLKGLIHSHPRLVEAYLVRSEIYAELGAYDVMMADLEQALRVAPRSPRLLMRHAHCCSALGRIDDAYRDLAILQRIDPHDSRIFALRAYIRRRSSEDSQSEQSNRSQALEDVERALKVDPKCAMALGIRAEIQIATDNYEAAIDDCQRALECDPGYVDAHALRGLARYRQGRIDEAAVELKSALERGCLLHFVRPLLAEVQHLQGDHDAALDMLDAVLEQAPDDVQVQLHKATLLLNSERPQEALDLVNQLLDKHPDLATAYSERGKARRALQQLSDALDDFTEALKLGTTDPLVRLNRALTLLDLERYTEALDEFTVGLEACPDSAQGFFYRGCAYQALQQFDAALADFNTALRCDPDLPDAYFRRAWTHLSLQDYVAAIDDFTILVERFPQPIALAYRGQAKILAGQLEAADLDFQEAIQQAPGETENFRMIQLLSEAQYHHQREAYEEAIEQSSAVLDLDDQSVPALLQRAASRWYGNHFVEAIEDYSQALDITGPQAGSLNGRGQNYAELGEYELALQDLDQAIELCEESETELLAYLRNGRGLVLTGLQRFDEAAAEFEQSILARPGNAWVHYNQGLLYLSLNKAPQAVHCFRLALHLKEPALRASQKARALGFLGRTGAHL